MKIIVKNNWENLYWMIDEIDVTASLRKITLEFPDKTVEDFKVTWTEHQQSYSDMGHTHTATQFNAFIKLNINGIKLKINLLDIAKKVKVIDYKIRRPI